jgi:polyhydroxybutyrate depolymerase
MFEPYALAVRALRVVVVLVAFAAIVACSDSKKPSATASSISAASSSAAPECARPHPAGQTTETLDFQGQSRTYELYVPAAYGGARNVPVVFDFHGFGSNAKQQIVYGNFKPEANRDDFLIVAPDGQVTPAGRHFNLGNESGLQNDVAMVGALLDHLEATLCVDTTRVYATGMSDGGGMTSVLACVAADRFAAFGPVAVLLFIPNCNPGRPIPFTAFMGTADPIVPFDGGKVNCCGGSMLAAAPDTMAKWAAYDGCGAAFTDERLGTEVRKRTWPGCPGAAPTFYIIDGGGHTWPGGIPVARLGVTTTQIDASATLWDFFKSHSLPSR